MNIQSTVISATATASIVPGEPLATGSITIGNARTQTTFDEIDEAFSIDAIDMTGTGTLNFGTGVMTGQTGGTISGGAGKNADGEDVSISKALALHVRNTGTNTIQLETNTTVGTFDPLVDLVYVPPGGDYFVTAPTATAFTTFTIDILPRTGSDPISFKLMCLGKQ